ncbi:hypothetical protein SBA4_5890002 [Candidatus Sulfopaludibacter sp. SbA4]|nr:hypothetical protein SBA4_5890002 [Candidatus Sulfopaludibacter sp. SbA4]
MVAPYSSVAFNPAGRRNRVGESRTMDRIEANPWICGGKPVIRGTRIMVRNILGMVAGGYSVDRIIPTCAAPEFVDPCTIVGKPCATTAAYWKRCLPTAVFCCR